MRTYNQTAEILPSTPERAELFSAESHHFYANADDILGHADILCFSHLRWDFVFQRPQHLLTRFGRQQRVFFIEEPKISAIRSPKLEIIPRNGNVKVVVPHLPIGLSADETIGTLSYLVKKFAHEETAGSLIKWYYTPMALAYSAKLSSELTIYDCMDELSHFDGAHPEIRMWEEKLFQLSDLVFTGGVTLYNAKKDLHKNIHALPSSIDREHFAKARENLKDPADQASIPGPRIGFFGVIDERLDIELLRAMAAQRADWHFVLIGPVVKINPESLPRATNIHYLGGKKYEELPTYLANWDVAILPFALNAATKFISPTKTPEYLAGGKPVVSTRITDVVNPYGKEGLVQIASGPSEFITGIETALAQREDAEWRSKVDDFLSDNSWESTWENMSLLMQRTYQGKKRNRRHLQLSRA